MDVNILFLNNKAMDACGVSDMQAALKDVENAYLLNHTGQAKIPGKIVLRFGEETQASEHTNGRINAMPGYLLGDYKMAGIKWIGSGPKNFEKGLPRASVTMILNDMDTKLPICVLDGTVISTKRTGAAGGIAIKCLAKKDASVLTICGAGAQARTQLEAALVVRPTIQTVYIYDLFFDRSEAFKQEMEAKYPQITVLPIGMQDLGAAVAKSDIVITVTLADAPFLKHEWVSKGTLLMNMASFEMDYGCISIADKVVVDFWEVVKHRLSSSIAHMAADGLFKDEQLSAEIGEILSGEKTGRDNEDQIIYFNAVGAGILDIAIATRCYKKAKENGLGMEIPFWE